MVKGLATFDHVMVSMSLVVTDEGEADRVGADVTVTVALWGMVPPVPVQERV